MSKPALVLAVLMAMAAPLTGTARAETVEVFAAGSLRQVVGDVAKAVDPLLGIEVKAQFGGSGAMRERIEKGETPDLLLSADMGSPRTLEAAGRTTVPAIAFARNRECVVSRKALGLTQANLVDKLLARNVRVKTSAPVADPSGDYAFAIFDKMDALHPGAGTILKNKAQALMRTTAGPGSPGRSALAALFAANKIDATIVYCSAGLDKERADLASIPVPPEFDPHPVYGLAVLSAKPQAMRLVLFLLSEKGQAIIARDGLMPLLAAAQ